MVSLTRCVIRETAYRDHRTGRPWVIELCRGGQEITLRVKKERRRYVIPVSALVVLGARIMVEQKKAARAAARAAKRKERSK